jgi:Na+-translocating ferredoxin:NAD+ oxidoreductase RnfD subunit
MQTTFDRVEVVLGAAALGMLIGSMVRVVFRQMKKLDAKALASLVSLMVGAGVIGLFRAISGQKLPDDIYFYPLGLLLGYVFTAALEPEQQTPPTP